MDWGTIAIVAIVFVALLVSGQRICTLLMAAGMIGLVALVGFDALVGFVRIDTYYTVSKYTLSTVPLYVLMSQLMLESGIFRDAYSLVYRFGRSKFALGSLTLGLGGIMGAACGSGSAMAAGFATMAGPELQRYGYQREFSGSICAAAGSLSAIIPPSILIIVFGALTETSIGKLFMGAFIPGALVVLTYIGVLFIMGRFVKGTTVDREAVSQELATVEISSIGSGIAGLTLIFMLVGIIFGGIYMGVMTATEAGGVAAFVALIMGLSLRKLGVGALKRSLIQTAKITSMVLIIVVGAQIFGRFISLSMLPRYLVTALEPLLVYPFVITALVLIIYFVLAMFIEGIAIMVMTLPVLLPIMVAAGLDMIWIGVMVSLMLVYGLLTPPLGLSLYAVQGATGMPIAGLMRYCMVFAVVSAVITVPLCMVFPPLVTWLPSIMITW